MAKSPGGTRLRLAGKMALYHLLLLATVYLPVFSVSRKVVNTAVYGLQLAPSGWGNEIAEIVFTCVLLGYVMVLGVAAHVAGVLLLGATAGCKAARMGALLLAPLVPLTPLLLGWVRLVFMPLVDTVMATVAYGMACQFVWARVCGPASAVGGGRRIGS